LRPNAQLTIIAPTTAISAPEIFFDALFEPTITPRTLSAVASA
jgi:hypothetical protein